MNPFNKMIKDNVALLVNNGFDDASLNSFSSLELYKKRLEEYLSYAMSRTRWDDEAMQFSLTRIGFFNEDKDVAQFRFFYSFNEFTRQLALREVTGTMKGEDVNQVFQGLLPDMRSASAQYAILLDKVRVAEYKRPSTPENIARLDPGFTEQIDRLVFKQRDALTEKNYLADYRDEAMDRYQFVQQLRQAMQVAAIRAPFRGSLLVMNNAHTKPDHYDHLAYRLAFTYSPNYNKLEVAAIDARLGDQRKVLYPKTTDLLPAAHDLEHYLRKKQLVIKARQIGDHHPDEIRAIQQRHR